MVRQEPKHLDHDDNYDEHRQNMLASGNDCRGPSIHSRENRAITDSDA